MSRGAERPTSQDAAPLSRPAHRLTYSGDSTGSSSQVVGGAGGGEQQQGQNSMVCLPAHLYVLSFLLPQLDTKFLFAST